MNEKPINTMQSIAPPPLDITKEAYEQLNQIKRNAQIPEEHGLRVGVNGGGCAGISYILGFDSRKEDDQVFLYKEMYVYMNKAHGLHLLGMVIDWKDSEEEKGFIFKSHGTK